MSKKKSVLSVENIEVISFYTNRNVFDKKNTQVRFSINHKLQFAVEENIINLTLSVNYAHPEDLTNNFLSIEIENIFHLSHLNQYLPAKKDIMQNEMTIPTHFLLKIAELSVSHTRAILSQHTKGTFIQGTYLAVIDEKDFAKHIFGSDRIK